LHVLLAAAHSCCACVFCIMSRRPPISTLFPYTDALPIFQQRPKACSAVCGLHHAQAIGNGNVSRTLRRQRADPGRTATLDGTERSEEHTSELQSRENLVCRLLLEKKNTNRSE